MSCRTIEVCKITEQANFAHTVQVRVWESALNASEDGENDESCWWSRKIDNAGIEKGHWHSTRGYVMRRRRCFEAEARCRMSAPKSPVVVHVLQDLGAAWMR